MYSKLLLDKCINILSNKTSAFLENSCRKVLCYKNREIKLSPQINIQIFFLSFSLKQLFIIKQHYSPIFSQYFKREPFLGI